MNEGFPKNRKTSENSSKPNPELVALEKNDLEPDVQKESNDESTPLEWRAKLRELVMNMKDSSDSQSAEAPIHFVEPSIPLIENQISPAEMEDSSTEPPNLSAETAVSAKTNSFFDWFKKFGKAPKSDELV